MGAVIKAESREIAPVLYREAVRALVACRTLDEAKSWDNKADALAAWAKIYHDGEVAREAKQLKMHAYRRMGQLAKEMNPDRPVAPLRQQGVNSTNASYMRKIGDLSERKFKSVVSGDRIPSPGTLCTIEMAESPTWERLDRALSVVQSVANHNRNAGEVARSIPERKWERARTLSRTVVRYLNELARAIDVQEDP